jgi:hypothetical protein
MTSPSPVILRGTKGAPKNPLVPLAVILRPPKGRPKNPTLRKELSF